MRGLALLFVGWGAAAGALELPHGYPPDVNPSSGLPLVGAGLDVEMNLVGWGRGPLETALLGEYGCHSGQWRTRWEGCVLMGVAIEDEEADWCPNQR